MIEYIKYNFLNAFDYATSNTHVGWIENGIIENCTDLDEIGRAHV